MVTGCLIRRIHRAVGEGVLRGGDIIIYIFTHLVRIMRKCTLLKMNTGESTLFEKIYSEGGMF